MSRELGGVCSQGTHTFLVGIKYAGTAHGGERDMLWGGGNANAEREKLKHFRVGFGRLRLRVTFSFTCETLDCDEMRTEVSTPSRARISAISTLVRIEIASRSRRVPGGHLGP